MAFDEQMAEEMRAALGRRTGLVEKRMFGGLAWMRHGNMLCGLLQRDYIFRVGAAQEAQALSRPGARPMTITGRAMRGFVMVEGGAAIEDGLEDWIALAQRHAATLPPKEAGAKKPARRRTR